MSHSNRQHFQTVVFSGIAVVLLLLGLVVYYDSLLNNLQESADATLAEVLAQEERNFTKTLISEKAAMEGYAKLILPWLGSPENLVTKLKIIAKSADFEYVFFATSKGDAISSNGESLNLKGCQFFHSAMAGQTVISNPFKSKLRDCYIIAVATPVFEEGSPVGVLVGTFQKERLNELLTASFNGYGRTYIATNKGELIAQSQGPQMLDAAKNLFDTLEVSKVANEESYQKMVKNLQNGQSGITKYKFRGHNQLIYYDKLAINDWNVFMSVNARGAQAAAGKILINAILLTVGLVVIFIILLLYNVLSNRRFTRVLSKMAFVDDVTGYRSFSKFKIDAEKLLQQYPNQLFMFVKMDIENFKLINQVYSMEIGDKILKAVADALAVATNAETDIFARIYADEFVLLLAYTDELDWLAKKTKFEVQIAENCEKFIKTKLVLPQGRYRLQKGETNLAKIYEKANFALRIAKNNSSGSKELFFEGRIKEYANRQQEVEGKMEAALQQDEFDLVFQTQYRLFDEKLVTAEALVCWQIRADLVLTAREFVPLFEQNGFIVRFDLYVFTKVCKILQQWLEGGVPPLVLTVNVSGLSLRQPNFGAELCKIADEHQIPHQLLQISFKEGSLLENKEIAKKTFADLHRLGFLLVVDDFGAVGFLPELFKTVFVDAVKLNYSFFEVAANQALPASEDCIKAQTVIIAMVKMLGKLGIHTVAKGVATKKNWENLQDFGCEFAQGAYFAEPISAKQLEVQLLRNSFLED